MEISIERMDRTRVDDFYRVHHPDHGTDWCYCVAWWVETWEGWGERTEQDNRSLRDRLFREGHFDGYLLYADGEPIGWSQSGVRIQTGGIRNREGSSPWTGLRNTTGLTLSR